MQPFPDGNGGHNDRNSSHELTKLLPSSLPAKSASNPSRAHIHILNPTAKDGAYVNTEYGYIRKYLKELHGQTASEGAAINLYLHVGMAGPWDEVWVERAAYRQDFSSSWATNYTRSHSYYTVPDEIGQTVKDIGPCPWIPDVPIGLAPNIDIDDLVKGAKAVQDCNDEFFSTNKGDVKPIEIKPHDEAGTYCCGFTFYESMANRYKKKEKINVLFCHIPWNLDHVNLERARDAIVAIIVSAANQLSD